MEKSAIEEPLSELGLLGILEIKKKQLSAINLRDQPHLQEMKS